MRRKFIGGGILGAALVLFAPAGAAAQDNANLTLACTGSDASAVVLAPNAWSWRNSPYALGGMSQGRVPAQLGVLVEGTKVRVRPPNTSVPLFSKDGQDGWYELTDVAIDRLAIRGRIKWNRLDRSRLDIDRRTGVASFGSFSGVCQLVSTNPEATKF